MTELELLAPARNADIGIAAIDCGADAVYIGGPGFGARAAACNGTEEIRRLCDYAHKFGARVFVTFNTVFTDAEEAQVHALMVQCEEAGTDAFIIRDMRISEWDDIHIPLHASTQCAIRSLGAAVDLRDCGCSRIVLERELSLADIRTICEGAGCEVEAFVHGALCTGYSGECRLSQKLDGRSADRGECIQACRSLYNLVDTEGKVLLKDKALLSLKDLKLLLRLEEMADAGVNSFKIEGRLKNASYVKNVVREYSIALDAIVEKYPERYCRASFGRVVGGFTPDSNRTFNRGYTQLWMDGKRGQWASMDAPRSMGERLGSIEKVERRGVEALITLAPECRATLSNGDGFAFVDGSSITGFRGDVCDGRRITCKDVKGLKPGVILYRNISAAFEKELENNMPRREIPVDIKVKISGKFKLDFHVESQDGREFTSSFNADLETAQNRERAEAMLKEQLSKHSSVYAFNLSDIEQAGPGAALPLLSASTINGIRRLLASDLDNIPCGRREMARGRKSGRRVPPSSPVRLEEGTVLLKSRYCVKYELGICPKHQGAEPCGPLFLENNGRRLSLRFDCKNCEMTIL